MRLISYNGKIYRRKVYSGDCCDVCSIGRRPCSPAMALYCSQLDDDMDTRGYFKLCKSGIREIV